MGSVLIFAAHFFGVELHLHFNGFAPVLRAEEPFPLMGSGN